jgi:hypothetical protein
MASAPLYPDENGINRPANGVFLVDPATGAALASGGFTVSASQTRPADTTAYAANDVVGSDTAAGGAVWSFANIASAGGDVLIDSVELEIDVNAIPSGQTSYNLYLYGVTPPSALGDNAAFDLAVGDRASFLGKISLGAPVDEGSTLYVSVEGVNKHVKLTGTGLFAYLTTVGGFTPSASSVRKVTLHGFKV